MHPLVRQRRPGAAATQLFEPRAVVRLDTHRGVQAETGDVGAKGLARCGLERHRPTQGQHLPPGAGPEGDTVNDGRSLQWAQLTCLLTVGIRLSQVALAHVLDQHAPAREHLHQPDNDGLQKRAQLFAAWARLPR